MCRDVALGRCLTTSLGLMSREYGREKKCLKKKKELRTTNRIEENKNLDLLHERICDYIKVLSIIIFNWTSEFFNSIEKETICLLAKKAALYLSF